MRRIQLAIASLVLALGVGFAAALPVYADAGDAKNDVCAGLTTGGGACNDNGKEVTGLVRTIINVISVIAGFVAVVMIIVGGMKYITSGGESSKTASAKNTIIFSLIGLVIVAMAQVIVRFVLQQVV